MRKIPITKRSYNVLSTSVVLASIAYLYLTILQWLRTQQFEQQGTIIFASKISLNFFINYRERQQKIKRQNRTESLKQILEGKKNENEFQFPEIDVVYTFVNGTDEEWLATKNHYYSQLVDEIMKSESDIYIHNIHDNNNNNIAKEDIDKDIKKNNNENRYREHDELRYSIRSVLKYAPWVNKIHIVISNNNQKEHQVPMWLNTSHPKINIVTHSDIFEDKSYLPTFNTNAIESQLDNIPGLADNYLYINDDMFLGNNVTQYDFFHSKLTGQQIHYDEGWSVKLLCSARCDYRFLKNKRCDPDCNVASCNYDYGDCGIKEMEREKAKVKDRLRRSNEKKQTLFDLSKAGFWDNAKYVDGVFYRKFNVPPTKARNVIMHTPYLINKRMMKDLKQRFYDEFDWTASHKFRHYEDMQLSFSYFHYLDAVRVYAPTSSQAWHAAFQTINNNDTLEEEKLFLYDKLPLKWDDIETKRYYDISKSVDYQILKNCTYIFANEICNTQSSTLKNCSAFVSKSLSNKDMKKPQAISAPSFCQESMDKLLPKLRIPIHNDRHLGNRKDVDFRMLYDMEDSNRNQLKEIFQEKRKFITINDDMPEYQPKTENAFRCMYEGFFPDPSQLELRTDSSNHHPKCKSMHDFIKYKPHIVGENEHYRQLRLMKARNGWRLPTEDPSHAANFPHNNFSVHSNPDDIASMVSSKYAHLFRDRTRTFSSPTGKRL